MQPQFFPKKCSYLKKRSGPSSGSCHLLNIQPCSSSQAGHRHPQICWTLWVVGREALGKGDVNLWDLGFRAALGHYCKQKNPIFHISVYSGQYLYTGKPSRKAAWIFLFSDFVKEQLSIHGPAVCCGEQQGQTWRNLFPNFNELEGKQISLFPEIRSSQFQNFL